MDLSVFAALGLARAGGLEPAGEEDLDGVRAMIAQTAGITAGRRRWDLHDLVKAGALELEPVGLARRLADVVLAAEADSCLDAPGRITCLGPARRWRCSSCSASP
jgi:hypothetical protein